MMREIGQVACFGAGALRPLAGVLRPTLMSVAVALGSLLCAAGCGSQQQDRNLQPSDVGMNPTVKPIFDDGETVLFEVKRGLQFPIIEPDKVSAAELGKKDVEPYGRQPWITNKDVKVQLTWTLSNLDPVPHNVEVLVDPWNEFGRYYPGMQLADAQEQKFEPNLSGIDHYYVLDAASAGDSSRRHGTFTFADMNELAIDFSTVQNLIKNPPPLPGGVNSQDMGMDNPLPIYVNHAFNVQNHSYNDALVLPYVPAVVAGLTGIDFGFRVSGQSSGDPTMPTPPVTVGVGLEISIEIVDLGQDRVQQEGSTELLLKPTTTVVTVGSPVPAAM